MKSSWLHRYHQASSSSHHKDTIHITRISSLWHHHHITRTSSISQGSHHCDITRTSSLWHHHHITRISLRHQHDIIDFYDLLIYSEGLSHCSHIGVISSNFSDENRCIFGSRDPCGASSGNWAIESNCAGWINALVVVLIFLLLALHAAFCAVLSHTDAYLSVAIVFPFSIAFRKELLSFPSLL